jgi:hypothetical protein
MRAFYDLVHSPDDGGWYANVFDQRGVELFETDIIKTRKKTVEAVKAKYPYAELLKEFKEI